MEDYIYVLSEAIIMVAACFLQYYIAANLSKLSFLLPLIFAVLTFWLGFVSLLFTFVLIFIKELSMANKPKQRPTWK